MEIFNFYRTYRQEFHAVEYGASPSNSHSENTAAFNECLSALKTDGGGTMYVAKGIYQGNCKVPKTGGTDWVAITIEGESQPPMIFGTIGTFTLPTNTGTIIQSNTASQGAVIMAEESDLVGNFNGFSSVNVTLKNLQIRTANNPAIHGVDMRYAQQLQCENLFINNATYSPQSSSPTNGKYGLIGPNISNGAITYLRNISVSGYNDGIRVSEHTEASVITLTACYNGLTLLDAAHNSYFTRIAAQLCVNAISVQATTYGHTFGIGSLCIEHYDPAYLSQGASWMEPDYDINDSGNDGYCPVAIPYRCLKQGGASDTFTVNGGSSIVTVNQKP